MRSHITVNVRIPQSSGHFGKRSVQTKLWLFHFSSPFKGPENKVAAVFMPQKQTVGLWASGGQDSIIQNEAWKPENPPENETLLNMQPFHDG